MLQERCSPPLQKDLHRLPWVMEVLFAHMLLALSPAPSAVSCPVRELPGGAHREQDTQASTGGLRGGCPPSPLPRKQLGPNNALWVLSSPCCPCQPYYLSPWANSSCSRAHGQAVIMGTHGLGEPSSSLPQFLGLMSLMSGLASQQLVALQPLNHPVCPPWAGRLLLKPMDVLHTTASKHPSN